MEDKNYRSLKWQKIIIGLNLLQERFRLEIKQQLCRGRVIENIRFAYIIKLYRIILSFEKYEKDLFSFHNKTVSKEIYCTHYKQFLQRRAFA